MGATKHSMSHDPDHSTFSDILSYHLLVRISHGQAVYQTEVPRFYLGIQIDHEMYPSIFLQRVHKKQPR